MRIACCFVGCMRDLRVLLCLLEAVAGSWIQECDVRRTSLYDCNDEGMNVGESVTMNVGLQFQRREKRKRDLKRGGPVDLIW